jgi:hypothetical protein
MKDGFYTTKDFDEPFAKIDSGKGLYFYMDDPWYNPYTEVIWGSDNSDYVNQKIGPLLLLGWNK